MISIRDIASEEATNFRRPLLRQFAEEHGNPFDTRDFAFAAVKDSEVIGTIDGYVLYDWAYVNYLAISETHRRSGAGSVLLARVETLARTEGLLGVQLDTFRYQAPAFYAARGYKESMVLPGRTADRDRIFVVKRLTSP